MRRPSKSQGAGLPWYCRTTSFFDQWPTMENIPRLQRLPTKQSSAIPLSFLRAFRCFPQRGALMDCDMVRLVALDQVLWIVCRGMMFISLECNHRGYLF